MFSLFPHSPFWTFWINQILKGIGKTRIETYFYQNQKHSYQPYYLGWVAQNPWILSIPIPIPLTRHWQTRIPGLKNLNFDFNFKNSFWVREADWRLIRHAVPPMSPTHDSLINIQTVSTPLSAEWKYPNSHPKINSKSKFSLIFQHKQPR